MTAINVACLVLAVGQLACSIINVWRDRYDRATYNQASAAVLLLLAHHGGAA